MKKVRAPAVLLFDTYISKPAKVFLKSFSSSVKDRVGVGSGVGDGVTVAGVGSSVGVGGVTGLGVGVGSGVGVVDCLVRLSTRS